MVANEMELTDHDYVDTWLIMEKLFQKGLAKSLGVCNFNKHQIERILQRATVLPVTNQVECHPYLNQKKLYDFCKANNITLTAHTPLGGSSETSMEKLNLHKLLDNSQIRDISGRYGKSSARVLIRYQIQRGVIVIPKSVHKDRILDNLQVFDFALSADDMALIDGLDVNARPGMVDITGIQHHKYYPFNDEY